MGPRHGLPRRPAGALGAGDDVGLVTGDDVQPLQLPQVVGAAVGAQQRLPASETSRGVAGLGGLGELGVGPELGQRRPAGLGAGAARGGLPALDGDSGRVELLHDLGVPLGQRVELLADRGDGGVAARGTGRGDRRGGQAGQHGQCGGENEEDGGRGRAVGGRTRQSSLGQGWNRSGVSDEVPARRTDDIGGERCVRGVPDAPTITNWSRQR